MFRIARLPWVVGSLLAAATPAVAQQWAYEGSLGMTTGNYIFTSPTTTFGFTNGLSMTAGRLTLRAAWPIWLQNSTLIATSGPGGRMPSGGSSSGTVSDSGKGHGGNQGGGMPAFSRMVETPSSSFTDYRAAIGDPMFGSSVQVVDAGRVTLGVGGMVKFPVADTSSYGTGEWDFSASASATIRVGGSILVGVDAAWWYLGDLPELDFDNPISGALSVSHLVPSGRWALGLFGRGSTASVPGYDPPFQVGGSAIRFSGRTSIGLEVGVGLSESSPDFGIGAYWRVHL
jgi:hypothetical protein